MNNVVRMMMGASLLSFAAQAAEYYVSPDGDDQNEGTEAFPLATIDAAITKATAATDVIHVAPGTYATTTQRGPNLAAQLIGSGATRDDVVIQSAGTYRTLRMAANSFVSNVTIVGESTYKADKGAAIEMSGGTLVDCVVRDGKAKANGNLSGGNLYMSGESVVSSCEIYGGSATNRGGNVYLDAGTLQNTTIRDGWCSNVGGNVYQYGGTISNCTVSGGTSVNDGGNVRMNGSGVMVDSVISNGTITASASAQKKGVNVYMDSSAKLSRCHLSGGQEANYNGGSLCVYNSSARVEDCLVEGSAAGGVLMGATSYLYNTTVVNNEKYGFWSWSNTQHLYNIIVYGNTLDGAVKEWTGNQPNSSTANFENCATSSGSMSGYTNLVYITDDDFVDYANGDYQPKVGGGLIDAGRGDPRGTEASVLDLARNPRVSGKIDIGCYEYQKPEMQVRMVSSSASPAYAPSVVTLTHEVVNSASPENIVVTYDFGDGSARESTTGTTMTHTYAAPGVYTLTLWATNECEEESATLTSEGYVRIASSTVYLSPGNDKAAFPYDTPATACAKLSTAVAEALDGYTLLLEPGTYESGDQIAISKAITLRGTGNREDVILRNTATTPELYYHRVMDLNNASARVENLTFEGGCTKNNNGGNLRLASGVVSNCVIRNGRTVVTEGQNAAGSAVELGGSAILTHCIITNNVLEGAASNSGLAGGTVFVAYGSKNGHVSNCLIAYNRYVLSTDTAKSGTAGIRFGGSNDNTQIENNTIVSNVVEGTLTEDSAGLHCTTWYGRVRNNIVVGNYETGKGAFTSVKMETDHGTYVKNLTDAQSSPDELFSDFAHGDFTLKPGSPAYNRGTTAGLSLQPTVDVFGKPRVVGYAIDVGCAECQRLMGLTVIVK